MTAAGALARAGIIVSGAFLVSRILGYVRLLVIGNTFGATADLDAFFAAFRIPDLIFQLVAAGALSSALVPIVSGLFTTNEQQRAWRVVSTVINLMLIGLLVLAVGFFVLAPVIVPLITPGFEGAQLDKTIELTRIMLLSPIFLALGAVATSVLNAGGRFAAAAVAPIVYNLAIIGAAVLFAPTLGVDGLALGVVAGSLGHLLVQLRPLARLGFRYEPHIDGADPQARKALTLMAPRAIGLGASQITFIVVTSLATTLAVGSVSDFNFAFALLQIPLGIIGVPLGIVLLPTLSRDAAVGRESAFADLLTRALRLLVYVMIPIAVLAAVVRLPVVEILFGSGKISPADLDLIAVTLTAFLIGLTAHAMIAVLARAFYARQDTVTPVAAAVGAVAINCTLAVLLVGPLGLPGIALAIAIAAWVEALVLLTILYRRLPHFALGGLGLVGVEAIFGSVVAGAAAYGVLGLVGDVLGADPGRLVLVVEVTVVGLAFAAVYAVLSVALRIPELPSIVGVMADVLRRPSRS
ncbi:MAG: murein biosynthesis integral membrane protein MurJ [Chloroflexi bacterium RBG_16_69_14]|nr:MAG: murein biosynthesis integral membrane protein MurJ [Chloroflexi bacterium RBG_16_69_14]